MGRYDGRVVVVTGGSRGIGEGCARVFCAEGGQVVICAPAAERHRGAALATELTERGPGRCVFVEADVRDAEQVRALIEGAVARFGRLDCLINNAGAHPPAQRIEDVSAEEFEALVRLNLTSTFVGCKYALPHLVETKGTIVNMASMVGVLGQAMAVPYCATKAGQIGLTRALAVDAAPFGVRVNAVLPSAVDTPLLREWAATLPDPAAGMEALNRMHGLGRVATSEEIGRVCLILATEDSSFVTGQAIPVEGGASLDY